MDQNGYKSDLSTDEKVMMAIVRVAELFKKDSGAIFKEYGLTFPQYNVLRVLDSSGNGRNTISNVCKVMLVSGANMTGIAKRLETNGFLIRKSDPNDDRITILEITSKGRHTLKKISLKKDLHIQTQLGDFSEDEKKEIVLNLIKMLKKRQQK